MIYVIGPRDKVPEGALRVDVTSKSKSIFSPFYGSVDCPLKARNMENAWQYSKVYEQHDAGGCPSESWYLWHEQGLNSKWAYRYPMGKGARPEYTWFQGRAIGYIEARKELYTLLYRNMLQTPRHEREINLLLSLTRDEESGQDLALWDYDGYLTNDSFETILNNPEKKMGHAFVLREVLRERLDATAS